MDGFDHFGLSHIVALGAIVLVGFLMVGFMRSAVSRQYKDVLRITLGCLLIIPVVLDSPLTLLRHGTGDYGWEIVRRNALPFYLCDVVSIVGAIALFTKNRSLTEVTYLWGLAATTQGLITPTLHYDWNTIEYYSFFLQHGGVPITAVTLVWGMRIFPAKGAFKRIVIWSWAYILTVISINFLINQNYGFLSAKPTFPTMFDYMGPYPYYLITLQVIAFSIYLLLLKITPQHKD